ncbi:DUF2306 domain-containing protein [Maribacter sp. 2307ULW6-5]|uniref:DUF2306 domain-containing protein n=1 Tax=Maribacter sp. 2307ULW6-5 TaxID=3386275 RepID=UPI0039BD161E
MNNSNKVAWFVFGFLAVAVGLYPLVYAFSEGDVALKMSKSPAILASLPWRIGFYTHIFFGGLALMIGWVQLSRRFRNANLKRHRLIGRTYVVAALLSGLGGAYLAFFATGGLPASLGFLGLAVVWLYFTMGAYAAIKNRDLARHQAYMVYSYAACFAAVTLRVWLPLLTLGLGAHLLAYQIAAWLCWVPNMVFAFFWVRRKGMVIG